MIIDDYNELTAITSSCYMPMDVSGDAKKIAATKIAPDIADNLTTTTSGKILDARQGKILNDLIADNAEDINALDVSVHSASFYHSQQWKKYASRSDNSTELDYPTDAKEIMVVAYSNTYKEYFSAIFLPSMITSNCYLFLGGYMQMKNNSTSQLYTAYVIARILYETNKIERIYGTMRYGSTSTTYTQDFSDWSTEVWYK